MINSTYPVSGGCLASGGTRVSEVELGQPGLGTGRGMRRVRVSGLPFTAAAAVTAIQAKHVQVQTIPTIDFPNGVPPSAPARRT